MAKSRNMNSFKMVRCPQCGEMVSRRSTLAVGEERVCRAHLSDETKNEAYRRSLGWQ